MTPFLVLIGSWILFRCLGWLGVRRLNPWNATSAYALALVFLFTGATHFSSMATDYLAMLPPPLPRSIWIIYFTGGLELLGAVGLLIPARRSQAALGLIVLLLLMFPANVYAALALVPFRGQPPTPLALRAGIQLGFILTLWFTHLRAASTSGE